MADQAVKDLNNIFQGAAANKRFSDLDILNNMYAVKKILQSENMRVRGTIILKWK